MLDPETCAEKAILKAIGGNQFLLEREARPPIQISRTDIAVVQMVILGMTAKAIAKRTHRSNRTVEHRLTRLCTKFACKKKVELAVKCARYGVEWRC